MFKAGWKISLLLFCITSCTSVPQALEGLRPGADKDFVLSSAGNPTRTFRENGEDHWIYTYFAGDQQYLRDVVFEDGKVLRVTRPLAKEPWMKDLEKASTLEEYERKAREHQRTNRGSP